MIRKATLDDVDFIVETLNSMADDISDDLYKLVKREHLEAVIKNDLFEILLIEDRGFIFLSPENSITLSLHTCILPGKAGKDLIRISNEQLKKYAFRNGYKKIITQIPKFNKKAYLMARWCGFKVEGINKKSFQKNGVIYDQYYMGICEE